MRAVWYGAGYRMHRVRYASRRVQAQAAIRDFMAVRINQARAARMPFHDMTEVLTFDLDR
jgi:hypothetical protein